MGGGGGLIGAALMLQELPNILGGLSAGFGCGYGCIFGWLRLPRAIDVVFGINVV